MSEEYCAGIRESFEGRGGAAFTEFEATTDPLTIPIRELVRIDVPLYAVRTE